MENQVSPSEMKLKVSPSEMKLMENVENAEKFMQEAILDKAIAQGKFEIAADVLHDIGNAVVEFGSYLTRIRRSVEQNSPENLKTLAGFFAGQQSAMGAAMGEAKAGAVVSMLNSM